MLCERVIVEIFSTTAMAALYVNKIRQRARNTPGDSAIVRPTYLLKDYIVADLANDDQQLLAI
jgi:hypothetical protein